MNLFKTIASKALSTAISQYGEWRVGKDLFTRIKELVSLAEDTRLSGKEKKALVLRQFATYGYQIGDFLLNLAIEIAVDYINAKLGKYTNDNK